METVAFEPEGFGVHAVITPHQFVPIHKRRAKDTVSVTTN